MANNSNLIPAQKGEIRNPSGRPKKSFSLLNQTLKDEGYEPITKAQLLEAYQLLFSLDEAKIKELASDKEQPLVIRLIIKDLVNSELSLKVIQDARNYIFGTATQQVDLTSKGNEIQTITLFELPKNGRDQDT